MSEKVIFKSQLKPILLEEIKKYRDQGATFSEIAAWMNKKRTFTLLGKAWTENYMYRFFTENK